MKASRAMQISPFRPVPFMTLLSFIDFHLPARPGRPIPVFMTEKSTPFYKPFL
jgi:hypothetical protein